MFREPFAIFPRITSYNVCYTKLLRPSEFWGSEEILAEASRLAELVPLERDADSSGPARVFRIKGGKGRLGLSYNFV